MATTNDFEKLNNAIVRASLRGGEWNTLAVDWNDEVADERNWKSALPVMWSSLLNYYWTRYAALYGKTPDKGTLVNPYDVAPGGVSKALKDLWAPTQEMTANVAASIQAQIDQASQAAKDAVAKAAADVGAAAAKGAADSTNQWLWALGAGVIALGGLYLFGRRIGAFSGLGDSPRVRQTLLKEMRDMLRKKGYSPDAASKLQAEGMGPYELEQRLRVDPGRVGSLEYTHNLHRTN